LANHWYRNTSTHFFLAIAFLLTLAVACGAAATATPQPTVAPTEAMAAPTAMAEPTTASGEEMMMGGKVAPSFANYWKPPTDVYGEPISGGHLRVIYEDPLEHANSWGAATGAADRYRVPTMNNIVQENPYDSAGGLIPDLAEGWTLDDDSQGVTFNFHEGIQWHNGDAFTCEDARFTIQTVVTVEGITASYMKSRYSNLDMDTLACEDDQTLSVRFISPRPVGLLPFGNRRAMIFNKAWFQAGGEDAMFQDASVGTGAFTWSEGQDVGIDEQRFERNPNYFLDGLPYLDELTIFGILDESAQQAALLAHQADWHWVRNWGQYDAYVNHEQINTVIRATRGNFELWMNARNAPFDNVRVRQAIMMGIDRAAGIQVLQDGRASTGFMMVPGGAWALSDEQGCQVPGWCVSEDMDATRAEAKKILEEEDFDFDKTYLFTVESDAQVSARATFLQEQLRLLGIKTDFDQVETVAYRVMEQQGTWGDFLPGNDTQPEDDPSVGLGPYLRCDSFSNLWSPGGPCEQDTTMKELLGKVDSTVDPVERRKFSNELQLHAMRQYSKIPLYWEREAVAFWPEVRGWAHFPAPFGSWQKYQHMWIDPSHKDDKTFKGQTSGLPGGI